MPNLTIVYWRDIPAQVLVGRGRSAVKLALPERFEQAIDRAAMKAGLVGTDAYLDEWRRDTNEAEGDPEALATKTAARLDAEYDTARLKALIDAQGRA